ncbi:MAG: TPM domain-containing protein [Armatimonadetes bacterium]|jgi:uncharacterized protein|nr:TPM domain-containing protein [Armatimonadota bacterium]
MKCPRCGLIVTDQVPQCRGCGFSLEDLDRRAGRLPERTGFVSDHAGLLSPEERAALEQRLARFHEENGGEIVVATVATTRPVKPAEYVFWLFNRWNVGGPEHAGLLLLLAVAERRIESEVGYSWEPFVSDVESGEVLDEYVVPLLKEGRFAAALTTGVERLATILEASKQPDPAEGGTS